LLLAQSYFSRRSRFALQEQTLRTQSQICTEEDYLQAHLTVIERESRGKNPTLHHLKQWVTSVLKKWILDYAAALPGGHHPNVHLLGSKS
jgi:hypothetical protein